MGLCASVYMVGAFVVDGSPAPFTLVSSATVGLKAKDSGMSRLGLNKLGSFSELVGLGKDKLGSPESSRGKLAGSCVLSEADCAGGDKSDSGRSSESKFARSGSSRFSRNSAVIETEIIVIRITRKSMMKRDLKRDLLTKPR